MKVAAVVVVYQGLLDYIEVYSSTGKAHRRFLELSKEYGLTEDNGAHSDYQVTLDPELLVN